MNEKMHGQRASSVCVNTKNERNLLWQKSVAIHPATNQAVKAADRNSPRASWQNQTFFSDVKHVIGVVSGKGGVGKSFVTGSMANLMASKGYKVGIMDADITGPSIRRCMASRAMHRAVTMGSIRCQLQTESRLCL